MSFYFKENAHDSDFAYNLNENNFRLAVTIEDYTAPRQLKNDPQYVKWMFRMVGKQGGEDFEK